MLGRTATSATWSGPFSSAIRRRASPSTCRVKRADPAARDPARPPPRCAPRPAARRRSGRPGASGATRWSAVYADQLRQPGTAAGHRAEPARPSRPRAGPAAPRRRRPSASSSCSRKSASASALSADRPASPARPAPRPPTPSPTSAREVDVEQRLEGRPLHLPLDQRGGVRVADGASGRSHGSADRAATASRSSASDTGQARPAQRLQEGDVAVDQPAAVDRSSLRAAARGPRARWSEACLRTTPRVSSTAFSSRSRISSAISVRAQSTDSAIDGAFFSSSSRSRPTVATSCSATRSRARAPATARSPAPARRPGSRGAGRGSAA